MRWISALLVAVLAVGTVSAEELCLSAEQCITTPCEEAKACAAPAPACEAPAPVCAAPELLNVDQCFTSCECGSEFDCELSCCKCKTYGYCDCEDCECDDCCCDRGCKPRHCLLFDDSTCDMPGHLPYFPTNHGYYTFRPYAYQHIRMHQELAMRLGESPSAPYATTRFAAIYREFEMSYDQPAELKQPQLKRFSKSLPNLESLLEE